MPDILSFHDAFNMVDSSVRGGGNGTILLLMGTQGYGKGEFSALVMKRLADEGLSVMHYRAVSGAERDPKSVFKSLLSQAGESPLSEDKSDILKCLERVLASNQKGTLVVLENVHNLLSESLDILMESVPIFRKHISVFLATTIIADETNLEMKSLINRIIERTGTKVVQLKPPEVADFELIANENGFVLPSELIKDIFAMTRGSISLFKNAIFYYKNVGMFGKDGRINESVSRFLPIPPSQDLLYGSVMGQLSEKQRFILDILSILGGHASLDLLSFSTGMEIPVMIEECRFMLSVDILVDVHGTIRFASNDYFEFYTNYTGQDRIGNALSYLKNEEKQKKFPFYATLEFMLASNEMESLSSVIKEEGLSLYEKFPSSSDLDEFISRAKKILTDRMASEMLDLLHCTFLYRTGSTQDSRTCFESHDFNEISTATPKLILSRIYSVQGEYDKSLDLLDSISKNKDTSTRDLCEADVIRSIIFFRLNRLDEAKGLLEKVIETSKKENLPDILAEAYENMGNVEMAFRNGTEALNCYSLSNEICRKEGYRNQLIINTNNSALVYDYEGDFDHEIENYLEVIKESHLLEEKRVRAYSVFNLIELYDEIGMFSKSLAYIDAERNLIQGLNDNYLRYQFTRYIVIRNILMEKFSEASDVAASLVEMAGGFNADQFKEISLGLRTIADYFSSGKSNSQYDAFLLKDYPVKEDRLPIFYILGLTYFFSNNDVDSMGIGLDRLIELSKKSGDYFSNTLRKVAEYSKELFYRQKVIEFSRNDSEWIAGIKIPFLKLILEFLYFTSAEKRMSISEVVESVNVMNRKYAEIVPPLILHFIELLEVVTLSALFKNTSMEILRGLIDLDSTPFPMLKAMNSMIGQVKNVR
jgi:tetratricopeptide (TPR) repeat protein